MSDKNVDRRDFLKAGAATTAAMTMAAKTYSQVQGANERVGIAFIGVGGRCQAHINTVKAMAREDRDVQPVAVCDVWDGDETLGRGTGKGLYPSARKIGLQRNDNRHITKDYRRILELREVDAVCIATPDHWHAKITVDAADAGKDIYCEKPMTKTIEEAQLVVDAVQRRNRVMTVGVQSMANPIWRRAYDMIRRGEIGHVAQAMTSYYRNSLVGQWRYYPLTRTMNPTTIDWDMFLGHRFNLIPGVPLAAERPFDRAVFAQWRCYWDFGGGMYTDLFVHQTTHMIEAMGVRYPARVVGGGGIYLEYDDRDVPDVATVVADYDEGCQLIITATMINNYNLEETIRGRLATLKFGNGTYQENGQERNGFGIQVLPENISDRPTGAGPAQRVQGRFIPSNAPLNNDRGIWRNFIDCVKARNRQTISTPELGAAAFTTVSMGVRSYREGRALFWDQDRRQPVPADASWAQQWERRSHERGRPNQIIGWRGGNRGSTLQPPEYQSLAGPWTNGRDPAAEASGGDS